jgi:cytochrome P450
MRVRLLVVDTPALSDPDFYVGDPDAAFTRMRSQCPVAWHEEGTFWGVTRHADVSALSKDPASFTSSKGVLIADRGRWISAADSILYVDPPTHVAQRQIVNKAFTARRVAALEPEIRRIVVELLDAVKDPGEPIDLVDLLASPVPLLVIAHMLGVPGEDLAQFRTWSDAIAEAATNLTEDNATKAMGLMVYFNAKLDAREAEPTEDLLSVLVAEKGGLTRQEQLGFCMSLLVAGNETTRGLISGGVLALAEHPDQRAALVADPTLIPAAVEEMLRWVTPITAMARTANAACTVGGQDVEQDAYLVMLYASANRDEEVFGPDAGTFDVTRSPNPHLAFGIGEHFCLGAQLARLEGRIVFEELLARFPAFEVLDGVVQLPSTLLRQWETVPLRLAQQSVSGPR